MNSHEKYDATFIDAFLVDQKALAGLKYQDIASWDSVGHMRLMAALEEAFGIELDIDDIIDFSSYEVGKVTLSKYGVTFEGA